MGEGLFGCGLGIENFALEKNVMNEINRVVLALTFFAGFIIGFLVKAIIDLIK